MNVNKNSSIMILTHASKSFASTARRKRQALAVFASKNARSVQYSMRPEWFVSLIAQMISFGIGMKSNVFITSTSFTLLYFL